MERCAVNVEQGRGWERYVLADSEANARVELHPHRGALVTRFEVDGVPALYLDEDTLWDESKNVRGGIPLLFPIAGKAKPPMKQHGFARNLPWKVTATHGGDTARVRCELFADEQTRALFPFDFHASYEVHLSGTELVTRFTVHNRSAEKLPLHYGLHPYFFVPDAAKKELRVGTNATRAFNNRSGETEPFHGFDFTQDELDLHLLNHTEKGALIERPGMASLSLRWDPELRVMVVWTVKGKDYVCVEPWTARGGALETGEGLLSVAPGTERSFHFAISVDA